VVVGVRAASSAYPSEHRYEPLPARCHRLRAGRKVRGVGTSAGEHLAHAGIDHRVRANEHGRHRSHCRPRPTAPAPRPAGLAIETGLRWGELIALRPCDIDFTTHTVHVRRTIGEVAKKHSPTGERCFVKDYPKDDEQRHIQIDRAACRLADFSANTSRLRSS
jgi:integrase